MWEARRLIGMCGTEVDEKEQYKNNKKLAD
jgi:hypothetical protein